ncbi:response regulator transcription factor [Gryllotalpicola reticulitermitis]|uniref:Response regulator transcription factor n=1 Tax=Gryllotalpicola reticulitermitis TaxID=1184153 RepID=A0ABV8Q6M9_9MICO
MPETRGESERDSERDLEVGSEVDPERVASRIYIALAEQRYGDAADLAEQMWPVLVTHQLPVLRAVADRLTLADLAERPGWDHIRRYLNYVMVDPALRPSAFVEPPSPHPPTGLGDRVLNITMRSIAARTAGRLSEAVNLAREAGVVLENAREADRAAIQHRLPDAYLQWGLSFEFAALEDEAFGMLARAYDGGVAFGNTRVAADAAGELAWLNALAGHGPSTDQWIERSRALAASSRSSSTWRRSDLLAAAIRVADGLRPADAVELLATRSPDGIDEHRLSALSQLAIFRFSAGLSSPTLVLSELRRAVASDGPLLAEHGENSIVLTYAEALVQMYTDRPDRSIELLDRLSETGAAIFALGLRAAAHLAIGARAEAERDAETAVIRYGQWPRQSIPALLVMAAVALEAADNERATRYFTDACELAIRNSLVSSLVVIPHADFTRLLELAGERVADPRLTELARRPLVFAPPRRMAVNLSPRELEVLRELANGGTIADAAKRLHLSLNTMKVHNHSIYRKLAVDNRDDAVRRAMDRGII